MGRHFTLVTDHKPLTSIFSPDKTISPAAAARLQRYAAFLSGQSYSIEYRNTKDHSNADGLSRLPLRSGDKEPVNYTLDLMYVDMERSQLDPLPVTAQQVKLHTQRDLVISKAYEATRLGWSVLTHYDPSRPLRVACDASPYGIGGVLSNIMPDGKERPIAYASRSLNPAEPNYAQIDKEALALVWGVKKFYMYLWAVTSRW